MCINITNMKWFVIFLFIFLNLQFNYGTKAHVRQKRIVGGYMSPEGLFPYAVSLRIYKYGNYIHFCGGAIITERFILSSAHCVIIQDDTELQCLKGRYVSANKMTHQIIAVVGTNQINSESGTIYPISSFLYHADFGFKLGLNDISLIKTSQQIRFNRYVSPISIHKEEIPPNSVVIVPGWGLTSYPGEASERLKYIDLRTISYKDCAKVWKKVFRSQICTLTGYGEGVCTSDSGGPLIYKGELVGLVSFGKPCAVGYPDVFTNVTHMEQWIAYNMECLSDFDFM